MGPAVYSVTLNGAPAAASPQVNEFWVDRRLSAHPLHREEALEGEGRRASASAGTCGGPSQSPRPTSGRPVAPLPQCPRHTRSPSWPGLLPRLGHQRPTTG